MATFYPQPSEARFHALRLLPGQEVFSALHAFIQQHQLQAAWIAGCTGSLTNIARRFAGREETTLLTGTWGIISLNGTLELVIGELTSLAFSRQPCAVSGYDELVISSR